MVNLTDLPYGTEVWFFPTADATCPMSGRVNQLIVNRDGHYVELTTGTRLTLSQLHLSREAAMKQQAENFTRRGFDWIEKAANLRLAAEAPASVSPPQLQIRAAA